MRGATFFNLISHVNIFISTHAPHARRDEKPATGTVKLSNISTHAPHARRDQRRHPYSGTAVKFLLTRLMRGATNECSTGIHFFITFLLTRLMRGATRMLWAFLAGLLFLRTRLMRGATALKKLSEEGVSISTHAPHARRDLVPLF